eukprot:CAMPEP_0176498462 /NCGR_PEP_ID=MMETSP0200_2-20121128/12332_1 /TAXON_ID=947934 /ORGANISM="Chaetoceros sp., Strain GSL56" /LENGTH=257 /DNA_ID=CAMNT_0017896667 /DNA_START=48 /DNA_END=824 /DNA_ORIENTATION=-
MTAADANSTTIYLRKEVEPSNPLVTSSLSKIDHVLPLGSIRNLVLVIEAMDIFDTLSLASLTPLLSQNFENPSRLIVQLYKNVDATNVHTAITLAGLTAESEHMVDAKYRRITCYYKPPRSSTVAKINTHANTIKINIDLDDEDMINEEDLLNGAGSELLNAPPEVDMSLRDKNDCDGRKPCDNCTCGRAEREQENQDHMDELKAVENKRTVIKDFKSSCGNCAKGDAFRCAGCPFLGKPAFKEGEEHLILELADDL